MIPAQPLPDFRSPDFLRAHVRDCMAFYHPRAIDPSGGLFHFFRDNGEVYDHHTRHLVSSTRFVVTYAMAVRSGADASHRQTLAHAFDFLRRVHRDPHSGGYTWLLDWRDGKKTVLDGTQHAYGLAFVLLAHAHGLIVTAIHVDHGLRTESASDIDVIDPVAESLGISVIVHSVQVEHGPNLEARARAARYGVMPDNVMTGHTADDQAETVLINLLRGAGAQGLCHLRTESLNPDPPFR